MCFCFVLFWSCVVLLFLWWLWCTLYLQWKLSPYGRIEKAAHRDRLAHISTILQNTHVHAYTHTDIQQTQAGRTDRTNSVSPPLRDMLLRPRYNTTSTKQYNTMQYNTYQGHTLASHSLHPHAAFTKRCTVTALSRHSQSSLSRCNTIENNQTLFSVNSHHSHPC